MLPVSNSSSQLRRRHDGTIGNWQHWQQFSTLNPQPFSATKTTENAKPLCPLWLKLNPQRSTLNPPCTRHSTRSGETPSCLRRRAFLPAKSRLPPVHGAVLAPNVPCFGAKYTYIWRQIRPTWRQIPCVHRRGERRTPAAARAYTGGGTAVHLRKTRLTPAESRACTGGR